MPNLEGLLARLIEHRVSFVLVGGFAAVAHGSASTTQDVDVCCDLSVENLQRLDQSLRGLHPMHRMLPQRPPLDITPEFCRGLKNLYLATDIGQLDCLGEIAGVGGYEAALAGSEELRLPEGSCRILTLDTLIRAKAAMDRPRDREVLLQLESIRERLRADELET